MNDFGLDLAVIGNGRTAALIEPSSRLIWWCFPRLRPGDAGLFHLLHRLGVIAKRSAFEPDAGIWEYRGRVRGHTHSASMCWAACNRLAAIAQHLGLKERAADWRSAADGIQSRLIEQVWNARRDAFTAGIGVDELDASVLLLPEIGLVEVDDPRFVQTVDAIEHGTYAR